ncbi:MAG: carboxypeptidase regulatory-like domain-containing protein [Clostridiaceae bacterium]|jgi:hypothetical protein|nr:carboxypeptidase regulatory-like domain-containing protein [Clostridiaceae bacterium]
MKLIKIIIFIVIVLLIIVAVIMIQAIDEHGLSLHAAGESVTIRIVAKSPSGEVKPVAGALCQVKTSMGQQELWSNEKGLIQFAALGEVAVTPVALPPGYKYLDDTQPILQFAVEDGMSIPLEGEEPPVITVATSIRVNTLTVDVVDAEGRGVIAASVDVYTAQKGVHERIKTDENGRAVMSLGAGFYRIAVTEVPEGCEIVSGKDFLDILLSQDISETFTVVIPTPETTPVTTEQQVEVSVSTEPSEAIQEETTVPEPTKPEKEVKTGGSGALVFISIISLLTFAGVAYLVFVQINIRRRY